MPAHLPPRHTRFSMQKTNMAAVWIWSMHLDSAFGCFLFRVLHRHWATCIDANSRGYLTKKPRNKVSEMLSLTHGILDITADHFPNYRQVIHRGVVGVTGESECYCTALGGVCVGSRRKSNIKAMLFSWSTYYNMISFCYFRLCKISSIINESHNVVIVNLHQRFIYGIRSGLGQWCNCK